MLLAVPIVRRVVRRRLANPETPRPNLGPNIGTRRLSCGQIGGRELLLLQPGAAASRGLDEPELIKNFKSLVNLQPARPRRCKHRSQRFNFRQPPARLFAMICLTMALSAAALRVSPWRTATVRAVLLSWPAVMIPSGSGTVPPSEGKTMK